MWNRFWGMKLHVNDDRFQSDDAMFWADHELEAILARVPDVGRGARPEHPVDVAHEERVPHDLVSDHDGDVVPRGHEPNRRPFAVRDGSRVHVARPEPALLRPDAQA